MKFNSLTLVAVSALAGLSLGCGLEELVVGGIIGEPQTPIPGSIPDGAAQLSGELGGVSSEVNLSFYNSSGVLIEPLVLDIDYRANPYTWSAVLPTNDRHFNVRAVAEAGGVIQKAIIAEPYSDEVTDVGAIDATSTAVALALELTTFGAQGSDATPTPEEPSPTPGEQRVAPSSHGGPHLGALPCEAIDSVTDAILAQIDSGVGPGAELYAEVERLINARTTPWSPVVTNADDIGDPGLAQLAQAAADSAPTDGELDPDNVRVIMSVVRLQAYPDFGCQAVDIDKWVNPSAGDRMFLTGGIHEDSPVQSAFIQNDVFPDWIPNTLPMWDDGTHGDETPGDDIWTVAFSLPRGLRIGYKFTYGLQGEGWTGTEEWPGNQRILEIVDVNGDGYVARFDIFADERSNKDKQNLYIPGGTTVTWDTDLNNDGYLEAQEQPADFVGGDCVTDGWWQPLSLPPVTLDGCY